MRLIYEPDADWDAFALEHGWFWHTSMWRDHAVAWAGRSASSPAFAVFDQDEMIAIAPAVVPGVPAWAPAVRGDADARTRDIALELCLRERSRLQLSPLVPSFPFRAVEFAAATTRQGWTDASLTTSVISLTTSELDLLRRMSKGHRHAVRHSDHIAVRVTMDATDFETYRGLHEHAAGRVTRPAMTFDQQRDWLRLGYGAMVVAEYGDKPVGAAYLIIFGESAYYASSATLTGYRNEPIGHAMIWNAIRWLQDRGLWRFELGVQHRGLMPYDDSSLKERSVSLFKRGFGGSELPLIIRTSTTDRTDIDSLQDRRAPAVAASAS